MTLGQLHKLGYTAESVGTGTEVLKANANEAYEVILMDCQMPKMDGYETTHAIRKLEGPRRHTWIIAMTATP